MTVGTFPPPLAGRPQIARASRRSRASAEGSLLRARGETSSSMSTLAVGSRGGRVFPRMTTILAMRHSFGHTFPSPSWGPRKGNPLSSEGSGSRGLDLSWAVPVVRPTHRSEYSPDRGIRRLGQSFSTSRRKARSTGCAEPANCGLYASPRRLRRSFGGHGSNPTIASAAL